MLAYVGAMHNVHDIQQVLSWTINVKRFEVIFVDTVLFFIEYVFVSHNGFKTLSRFNLLMLMIPCVKARQVDDVRTSEIDNIGRFR